MKPEKNFTQVEIKNHISNLNSVLLDTVKRTDSIEEDKRTVQANVIIEQINNSTLAQFLGLSDAQKWENVYKAIRALAHLTEE